MNEAAPGRERRATALPSTRGWLRRAARPALATRGAVPGRGGPGGSPEPERRAPGRAAARVASRGGPSGAAPTAAAGPGRSGRARAGVSLTSAILRPPRGPAPGACPRPRPRPPRLGGRRRIQAPAVGATRRSGRLPGRPAAAHRVCPRARPLRPAGGGRPVPPPPRPGPAAPRPRVRAARRAPAGAARRSPPPAGLEGTCRRHADVPVSASPGRPSALKSRAIPPPASAGAPSGSRLATRATGSAVGTRSRGGGRPLPCGGCMSYSPSSVLVPRTRGCAL